MKIGSDTLTFTSIALKIGSDTLTDTIYKVKTSRTTFSYSTIIVKTSALTCLDFVRTAARSKCRLEMARLHGLLSKIFQI